MPYQALASRQRSLQSVYKRSWSARAHAWKVRERSGDLLCRGQWQLRNGRGLLGCEVLRRGRVCFVAWGSPTC